MGEQQLVRSSISSRNGLLSARHCSIVSADWATEGHKDTGPQPNHSAGGWEAPPVPARTGTPFPRSTGRERKPPGWGEGTAIPLIGQGPAFWS